MAFLCPVRIRNSNSDGTRKKKQDSSSNKKRSFLSATVNSLINGDRGSGGGNLEGNDGNKVESDLVLSSSNNNNNSVQGVGSSSGAGRITGSSSIETLVRVGLEKEAGIAPEGRNMVVLHDFNPCVDDELEVRRGDVVSILYRENDWVYVILEQQHDGGGSSREGFIPHSYCAPYGSPLAEIAMCGGSGAGMRKSGGGRRRDNASMSDSEGMIMSGGGGRSRVLQQFHVGETASSASFVARPHSSFDGVGCDNHSSCSSGGGGGSVTTAPFFKDPSPTRYIALYKFTARDENDVNVERGELLTVLNKDDPDWFYVVRSDGNEGFVPSAFVYPLSNAGSARVAAAAALPQNTRQPQQPTYQQISGADYSVHSEENEYADAGSVHVIMPSPQQQQPYQPPPPPPQQQQGVQTRNSPQSTQQHSSGSHQATTAQQYGTELVMLYDYKAQAPDDLSVRRGDWVYADLLHQTVEGWLWAYAPKQRKYGFIPKAYARPPAMTSL